MINFSSIFNKFLFIIIAFFIYSCGGSSNNNTSNKITNQDIQKIDNDIKKGINDNTGINKKFKDILEAKQKALSQNDYLNLSQGTKDLLALVGTIVNVLDNDLLYYIDEDFTESIHTETNNNNVNYYAYDKGTNMVSLDPIPTKENKDYKNKDGKNDFEGTKTIVYGTSTKAFKFAPKFKKHTLWITNAYGSNIVLRFASITKGTAINYLSHHIASPTIQKYCQNYGMEHNVRTNFNLGLGNDKFSKITYNNLHNRDVILPSYLGKNKAEEAQIENRSNVNYNDILKLKGTSIKRDLSVKGTTIKDLAFCRYKNQTIRVISGIDNLIFTPYDTKKDWANSNALNNQKSNLYLNIQKIYIYHKNNNWLLSFLLSLGWEVLKINGLLEIPQSSGVYKKLKVQASITKINGKIDGKIEFSDYKGSKIIAVLNNKSLGNTFNPDKDYYSEMSVYKFYKGTVSLANLITNKEFPLRLLTSYYLYY